jgi:DNA-binding FadR family transcriptional regulator
MPETHYPSRNLHGQIVHSIGRQILQGELLPGEAIPAQPDLPASRTAVREAIKVLVAKGLVETRPRTGTRVRAREAWNMLDPDVLAWGHSGATSKALLRSITEVRSIVEPAAAELAARRATAPQLAEIEQAFRDMESAMPPDGPGDVEAFVSADTRFHTAIFRAAGNDLLEHMSGAIYAALRFSFESTSRVPGSARGSLPHHRAVMEAIRARKPASAGTAMRGLVRRIARRIERMPKDGAGAMRRVGDRQGPGSAMMRAALKKRGRTPQ